MKSENTRERGQFLSDKMSDLRPSEFWIFNELLPCSRAELAENCVSMNGKVRGKGAESMGIY